ncbi:MAG: phosphoenolpyruvate synthase [Planctomycetes bacterium]|nr:phosphoenolpyruvate synthase [Planctomycetota bacterium]
MRYLIRDDEAELDAPLGGKARALASLRSAELPIPAWFVVRPEAFHDSVPAEQRASLANVANVETLHPSRPVVAEIAAAMAELCPDGASVAVRSSASDEDGAHHSFAGQLDSFLFVEAAEVPAQVAAVWRSGFGERLLAYRREHDLSPAPRPPTVLVQRMVQADVAGVAFGADPVNGRRRLAVVSAVYGLGTALVSGDADADTYHVDLEGTIVARAIADKRLAHRASPGSGEGVASVPVPEDQARRPALTDEQIRAVAELVRRTGRHFGRPQDIEWAIEAGQLYLLQSRPITSLTRTADPDGVLNIWDNSNIAESYNGVTTPLTFSFARRAYEEVYRQFCRMLSVPESKIVASANVFRHMLGLIRGRVYYNLLNWYRLIAMLPGFQTNRGFMEQMMGVKEGLPEHLVAGLAASTWWERMKDRFGLLGSVLAMVRNHFGIQRQIAAFYRRLHEALGAARPDLEPRRPDELVAYYRDLETKLLTRWDAPLMNDFFAMIFFGILGKLTRSWCGDTEGTLQNDLLCGEGGMVSAEPAIRVRALAEVAAKDSALIAALCEAPLPAVRKKIQDSPEFRLPYEDYLNRFGDRCLEELKLESPTLFDDPLTLIRSVGQLARRLATGGVPLPLSQEAAIREAAETRVRSTLGWRPLRRLLFAWVLRNARARVRDRENLRFERTRLFGRVRLIIVELGRKFHALDLIDEPRDIFYLEVEECLGHVTGTGTTTDLRALVALRKAEFERYRNTPVPSERFETRGSVHEGNTYQGKAVAAAPQGDQLKGLGCCPGVVRGRARVITDPRNATLSHGDILVAERTDPGWIMLFPSAAGLLVERGSLLSHSAIVSREMGIPSIVALTGVTRWLRDGDLVELDGSTGIVVRISSSNKEAPDGQ